MRPALCDEALRLARMLAAIVPAEAEVHGLLALLEIQASRAGARVDAQGQPVLLLEQDRSRWDAVLIRRGLASLQQAQALSEPTTRSPHATPGPYTLQAAIAACHARATRSEDTDWALICAHYDALLAVQASPVVALNRAVAVSRAHGAAAALPLIEALQAQATLARYHLLPSVHADLLERLDRPEEARAMWLRAADLTRNERERELLLSRARKTNCPKEKP
jgi:predicted RNA polymerase sigma factor